jgi:putative transposase
MTDDKIALRTLLEKGCDATFLREMIGFAAQRLMEERSSVRRRARRAQRGAAQPPFPRRTATRRWTGSASPTEPFEAIGAKVG